MRYIGNKTRLLHFIRRVLRARGIEPGRAVDPFSGTASVARALKRWKFRVAASDIMQYGHVFAHAYVEVIAPPAFAGLEPVTGRGVARVFRHLNTIPAKPGFIHEHYTPAGTRGAEHGRMYFTPENAARIDTVRLRIEEWHDDGRITTDEKQTLLAALIEAADRVANTTGVYAAFVKTWQPNALRPLDIRAAPRHVSGNGCHAYHTDALSAVQQAGSFDLLYLDPPYNARQYAGYYHIPELIARGWFDGTVATRGKTGLIDDEDLRSDWSSSRRAAAAFEQLVANSNCNHIMMSYNAEGLIPENTIERVLKEYGRRDTYYRHRHGYRRYRSDSDSATRNYRGDVVDEYLYCVSR